jgi:hypothetical protein
MRQVLLTIGLGMATALGQQAGQQTAMPVLPFYDWGACPYERCMYGTWTAHRSVALYDTWKPERRQIAQIAEGEKVTGLSGAVVTFQPGVIHMDRDLPGQQLQRGDTILTYAYRGEGFSAVWFQGKYYPEFDATWAKLPDGTGCSEASCAATYVDLGRKSWWAEVKLASGLIGWVEMDLSQMPVSLF